MQTTAPFACWTTFSFKFWVFGTFFPDWARIGIVDVQCLRLGSWAAPCANCRDFDQSNPITCGEGQGIADLYLMRGFGNAGAVDAQFAFAHQFRGQAARFEKPRMPKPLIYAIAAQDLPFSAINAANGLSGSNGLSFLAGAAE